MRKERLAGLAGLSGEVAEGLKEIGMPHASFEVRHQALDEFSEKGRDKFSFYFSANKNRDPELVQKVASGGEISRLMLSIKSLISKDIEKENTLIINLEDRRFTEFNTRLLDKIFDTYLEILEPGKKPYIFLDEIHNVPDWQRWVRE